MTQEEALRILKSDKNVFLTGQPGTGKTYLTNKYVEYLMDNNTSVAVTASTGIAATHIYGRTLHSFAGIRDDMLLSTEDMDEVLKNPYTTNNFQKTKVLIIDEISMISKNMLNVVSLLAQRARGNTLPFGGIKVVVVGDFFQLPPVKGEHCFLSQTWKDADFSVCYLHEQHRQSEKIFIDILTGIRKGDLTDAQKEALRERMFDDTSEVPCKLRLETHNADVDHINMTRLQRLPGSAMVFTMNTDGSDAVVAGLKKSCLSPEKLILKIGAPVMFTKNDKDLQYVNGTQGTITDMSEDTINVETSDGITVPVKMAKWEKATGYGKYKKVFGYIEQFPLRLAWAITTHKSQGMTLDSAIIDVTKSFAPGQGYVAISRVKSLSNIYFKGKLTKGVFMVDPVVLDFDNSICNL